MGDRKKLGVLIASHGPFSKGALESAQMIVGPVSQERVRAVGLPPDGDILQFKEEFSKELEALQAENEEILILTDIVGGTPNNTALEYALIDDSIQVISGFNLVLVINILFNLDQTFNVTEILDESKNALVDVLSIVKQNKAEEDDLCL